MSAATSPGTGLAYGLRRVCAAWGMARSSFYAMTSGQHAEQPPAKRRGPKPAMARIGAAGGDRSHLEASPWEGEGYRKVWARLRVCRDIRGCPQRVLRLMRENNLLSPHRCRRRGGNPHDGEIISCPEPHVHRWRSGVHGGRRLGLDLHRRRALERRVCRLAWSASAANRFAALSPWGLPGCRRRGRRGSGAGLADGSRLPVSVLHQPDQVLGAPSYAFVAEPQTNGVAERFNRTLKEQITMVASTATSRSCGTPSATSSNSTMPSGSSKRTAT